MGEIVEFPAEEELGYWLCNCGCQTHYVRTDGEVECANCGTLAQSDVGGGWLNNPPPERSFDEQSKEIQHIVNLDGPDAAVKRVLKRQSADNMRALVVLWADGLISTWGELPENRAQRGWLRRGLESARKTLVS